MIQLYVDILTNKITGYNRIVQNEHSRDAILIDEKELEKLKDFPRKTFFYINGEITEASDAKEENQKEADRAYLELRSKVENEQKLLLDNIISGMTVTEAADIARKNRSALKETERQREKNAQEREEKTLQAVRKKFEQEEKAMHHKYFLSMLTIVRDENDYIEEWIRYHIEELGFDHFYIYDNESAVPIQTYLEQTDFRYLDKITVIPWPTSENSQQDSHNDFLANYSQETKWFLAADPDEYVVTKDEKQKLKEFLQENSAYSTIQCLWKCFGANGRSTKSSEPDMLRFTKEVEWSYGTNKGKYFAQSNRVESFRNYIPKARLTADCLDYRNEKIRDFFQLNHYYTRSFEEWVQKMERGTAVPYAKRNFREFFELNPDMSYLDTGEDYQQEYGPGTKMA